MSQKRKVSAKQIVTDLRAGASNEFLMKKYDLSPTGLQSVFKKLLDAGLVTNETIIVNGIKVRAEARDKESFLCYERPH